MANLLIYRISDDKIIHFVTQASIEGKHITGGNVELVTGLVERPEFAIKWIDEADIATPIYIENSDGFDDFVGYEEVSSDFIALAEDGPVINISHDRSLYLEALAKRKEISDLSFSQLETYIDDNVTDLPSAKAFLHKLGKVVLGMIKISEYKG